MKSSNEAVIAETRVGVEPLVEILRTAEDLGQQEIKQSPQFMEVVLQRSAGEQQLPAGDSVKFR